VTSEKPTPDGIMRLGLGFQASKVLLSAVELGLFSVLAEGPLDSQGLCRRLGLHGRGALDFFDALVGLGMLERRDGRYANTLESDLFLDRRKASYAGGFLEMANARLYGFWGSLTEALRTGQPQNEAKTGGSFYGELYADPARLRQFLRAMSGRSAGPAAAIARKLPWHEHRTFIDIGAAQGILPVQVARAHPHLIGGGFDLPPVGPIFDEYIAEMGLSDRLRFYPGDFFTDPLPHADALIMGHVLHNWSLDRRKALLAKAHEALPEGGRLVVYETIIDDERRQNPIGLLASLNMLIETEGGSDYTAAECRAWMHEAGFRHTSSEPLIRSESMVVAIK
jgi:hypothetical protein